MIVRLVVSLSMLALIAFALLTANSSARSVKAAHVNDDLSGAIPLELSPAIVSHENFSATLEVGEPQPCASTHATVWYSYTPSADVTLAAYADSLFLDIVLAAYTGGSLETLTTVGCNDGAFRSAELLFDARAGVTYYFQLGNVSGEVGPYVLILHDSPAKGHDDFEGAVAISAPLPYSNTADIWAATLESDEPQQPCADIEHTIWYSYTSSSDGVLVAEVEDVPLDLFGRVDAVVAVYTGSSLDALISIGCDNNAGFQADSRLAFTALAGVTYHFQVGGTPGSRGGVVFRLSSEVPPAKGNDDFGSAAEVVQPLPFSNSEDTSGATMQDGEPQACGPIASSVWFSLTPVTDLIVLASESSSFLATAAFYTGNSLSTLELFECGWAVDAPGRQVVFSAGETYYIQIGGCISFRCGGSAGNLEFELLQLPCASLGCAEMALSVPGGSCGSAGNAPSCDVPVGEGFTLSIEILGAPLGGYIGAQSFVDYGARLSYQARPVLSEIVWPACVLPARASLTSESVLHGCLSEIFPPLPVSQYLGPFAELSLTCSPEPSTTVILLHREGHPLALTNGAVLTRPEGRGTVPKVTNVIINCVAPAAVGGVAAEGDVSPLRQLDPHESSDKNRKIPLIIISTALTMALVGWQLRRRPTG